MKIIFEKIDGTVTVKAPAQQYLDTLPSDWTEMEKLIHVANKDVPTGVKYKIVEDSVILSLDRTFRNAWEVAQSELTDGVGT